MVETRLTESLCRRIKSELHGLSLRISVMSAAMALFIVMRCLVYLKLIGRFLKQVENRLFVYVVVIVSLPADGGSVEKNCLAM